MSSLPQLRQPTATGLAPNNVLDAPSRRPPLTKRLRDMSDAQVASLQRTAMRISMDAEHPKQKRAKTALPLIDAEIGRRAASLSMAEADAQTSTVETPVDD